MVACLAMRRARRALLAAVFLAVAACGARTGDSGSTGAIGGSRSGSFSGGTSGASRGTGSSAGAISGGAGALSGSHSGTSTITPSSGGGSGEAASGSSSGTFSDTGTTSGTAASGSLVGASGTVTASGTVSASGTAGTSGTVSASGTGASGTLAGSGTISTVGDGGDAALGDATADVAADTSVTSYPASHPPLPQVVNAKGGPVLSTPRAYLVFYPGNSNQSALQAFAQAVSASTYWVRTTSEYGVGALSYAGSALLTGQTPPAVITSAQVQSWMAQEIAQGAFGPPDPQTIYTVVYPSTTTIQQPNPVSPLLGPENSCTAFYGYHDNVPVAVDGGAPTSFAYAVIATCTSSLDDQTATISHEWAEAATDPQTTETGAFALNGGPNAAYYSVDSDDVVWEVLSSGGEIGDLCQPEGAAAFYPPSDVGHTVQRIWSNRLAAASHDPCAPDPPGVPFFASAPVLNETVTFTSSLTGMITTKGVTIPLGTSRTIEVDLFSDAATSGSWSVTATDLLSRKYSSYGVVPTLSFQWDRTQGLNGDKLHLTITVTGASALGTGHAFVITSTLAGRSFQWPGVVVE